MKPRTIWRESSSARGLVETFLTLQNTDRMNVDKFLNKCNASGHESSVLPHTHVPRDKQIDGLKSLGRFFEAIGICFGMGGMFL